MTREALLLSALSCVLLSAGCGSPSAANIQLRKDKQQLEGQIAELQKLREADRARIAALEKQAGTVAMLPQTQLDRLFTVHGMEVGRLSGIADFDHDKPGPDGLRIYLAPHDESGAVIKATGKLVIEAFDLASPEPRRIGRWEFDAAAMKAAWRGLGPMQNFVFDCPWQTRGPPEKLTYKVVFTDELTGRSFEAVGQAAQER